MVETAVDGVMPIDARSAVMFDPASEKLFSYAAGEVIGKNVKVSCLRCARPSMTATQ